MALRKKKEQDADQSQGQKHLSRPSAEEIFAQVKKNARDELKRSSLSLGISGFAGGTFMGLSALGTAIALAFLGTGDKAQMISRLFYPIGFIVVIIGRSQLFTENTLYPVALVLSERKQLWNTLRLWGVVLPSNILGALTFASLAALTPALAPRVLEALIQLGAEAASKPGATIFWSGVMGGWIIALAAWLVSGSHSVTGSVAVIWMLTFVVGLGNFAHCIAGSCEVLAAVLTHHTTIHSYLRWIVLAVAGNICGGVGMVTVLEYGQVVVGGDEESSKGAEHGEPGARGEGPGHTADDLRVTPLKPVALDLQG